MVNSCSLPDCKNRGKECGGKFISYHSLPVNEIRRNKWIDFIFKDQQISNNTNTLRIMESTKICSEHFKPDDFIVSAGYNKLKITATPTIFTWMKVRPSEQGHKINSMILGNRDFTIFHGGTDEEEYYIAKYCLADCCNNNTYNTPEKIFIRVPDKPNIREVWFNALKVSNQIVNRTKYYVCEDHFDLSTDTDNWYHYKLFSSRLMLKEDIIPHLHLDLNLAPKTSQLSALDRKRKYENIEKYRMNGTGKKTEHKRFREKYEQGQRTIAEIPAGGSLLRKRLKVKPTSIRTIRTILPKPNIGAFEFIDVQNIQEPPKNGVEDPLGADIPIKEEPNDEEPNTYKYSDATLVECKSEIVKDEIDYESNMDESYLQIKTEYLS